MRIKDMMIETHKTAIEKGFWKMDINKTENELIFLSSKIALMHEELSEALMELRRLECSEERLAEEFADCMIRITDFCAATNLDLEKAIQVKMEINKQRERKHGKRF